MRLYSITAYILRITSCVDNLLLVRENNLRIRTTIIIDACIKTMYVIRTF
jgi:hypothetical protein